MVRCIIPSVMVNCHCLAFSGFRPTATRLRFCFCCSWLQGSMFLPKEALISLSANSSTSLKRFERFKARGRTAEYLSLDSRPRAYPWHCGRSLQLIALVGSRHGWCSRGKHGLGTVGPPNSECTRLDSTRLLLCLGRWFAGGLGTSPVA